jgi:hypothetical protein
VRIDRADVADELDAAGKDEGKAARNDGFPDSSSASLNSALRIERAAAYRAAVDAAYRQHASDHGYARAQEPGRETVTSAMPRTQAEDPERHLAGLENGLKGRNLRAKAAKLENPQIPGVTTQLASGDMLYSVAETTPVLARNANGPGYPTIGTAADDVQTGARGPASGREFDPEAAGGPIQQLDARKARITSEGVQEATAHLQQFTGGGPLEVPEQAMLDRLTSIAAGDMEPTSYDRSRRARSPASSAGRPPPWPAPPGPAVPMTAHLPHHLGDGGMLLSSATRAR